MLQLKIVGSIKAAIIFAALRDQEREPYVAARYFKTILKWNYNYTLFDRYIDA